MQLHNLIAELSFSPLHFMHSLVFVQSAFLDLLTLARSPSRIVLGFKVLTLYLCYSKDSTFGLKNGDSL